MRIRDALALVILVCTSAAMADEVPTGSAIDSISLFKNGLAVVHRNVEIGGPGVYRVEDLPEPVHGTFWVEGDVPVDVRETMRELDVPANRGIDFQGELVGRHVTIHFKEAGLPVESGTVAALAAPTGSAAWDREYANLQQAEYPGSSMQFVGGGFLVLDTDHGRAFVDPSEIAFLECADAGEMTRQRVPVLLLESRGDKKGKIQITYLTKGIAWAPSYRIDLVDDRTLTVEQQAVVKNELSDFKDAEIFLISGYPNIRYGHVTSPMALTQTWAQFFAQIGGNPAEMPGMATNAVITQNTASTSGPEGIDLSGSTADAGEDQHYQSIGKQTMDEGDSLMTSVAKGSAGYDRVVEWVVPDNRDADGQIIQRVRNPGDNPGADDEVWDAIRFRNPLPFAMTTAPAMIVDSGRFVGQQLSYWVNSGEETMLHVTKALSIRVRAAEQEAQNAERSVAYVGNREYRKVDVQGTLTISNHRDHDQTMLIRRQFSGDLVKADGSPKQTLREEGVYSVNGRNELTWQLTVKAGEEKALNYEYTVLVFE